MGIVRLSLLAVVLLAAGAPAEVAGLGDLLRTYASLQVRRAQSPGEDEALNREFMASTFKKQFRVEGAVFLYLSKHERNRFPAQAEYSYIFWMKDSNPQNILGGVDRFYALPEQVVPYPVYIVLAREFGEFPWTAPSAPSQGKPFKVDLNLYVPWLLGTPVTRMVSGQKYDLTFTLYRVAERRSMDRLGLTGVIEALDDPALFVRKGGGEGSKAGGAR
jgi:hypothetical protein